MKIFKPLISNKVPNGFQDCLTDECYNREIIKNKLLNTFRLNGFSQIDTPAIEYYDTFTKSNVAIHQKDMFKMTDNDGNLLVLRPDITLPISRIVATKLDNTYANKLCYVGNIFKNEDQKSYTQLRQQLQAGAEYIGESNLQVDADMLSLAINSLLEVGIKDFVIELNDVNFFLGLMDECGISQREFEEIRDFIEKKNFLEAKMYLEDNDYDKKVVKVISSLSSLYGDISVVKDAKKLVSNKKSLEALDNIQKVYEILKEYSLDKYLTIDLSLVQNMKYYTGVVYKGLTSNVGSPILSGGRYDGLTKNFGRDLNATGFAIDIKRVLIALEMQGDLLKKKEADVCVLDLCNNMFSYSYIDGLRKEGKAVEKLYNLDENGLKEYKNKKNIEKAIVIKDDKVFEL